jgi:hypothetical protein
MTRSIHRGVLAAATLAAAAFAAEQAGAAGAAYQVDTAEVSEAGACKVEAWASFSDKKDFVGAVSPACSVPFVRPLELSAQLSRARDDGEWGTAVAPKFKVNLISSAIGKPGVAFSGIATYDFASREMTTINFVVPVTLRLSDVVRINTNVGWLVDRTVDRHYLTYGVGVDWRTPDNVWTVTAEVFGQAFNAAEPSSVIQPRFQLGLRWRPIDRWNIDAIYGRNITGNQGNWFTVATVLRFPAQGRVDAGAWVTSPNMRTHLGGTDRSRRAQELKRRLISATSCSDRNGLLSSGVSRKATGCCSRE